MVDHLVLAVDTTPEGSSQALFPRSIEPDDGIESTWSQGLRWCWLCSWLHKELGVLGLALPLSRVQVCR